MQKQRHCEKNSRRLEFKKHHIPCATSNKTSVSKTDRIYGIFLAHLRPGWGGGRAIVLNFPFSFRYIFPSFCSRTISNMALES